MKVEVEVSESSTKSSVKLEKVGLIDGKNEGNDVSSGISDAMVGFVDGLSIGADEGSSDGLSVSVIDGNSDGQLVGTGDGFSDGL